VGTTARGLDVSTDDVGAVAVLDDFTDRLVGLEPGVEGVLEGVMAHPDVVSLRLGAAMLGLYGQTTEASALAAEHLLGAEALSAVMNERERAVLAALRRWDADDVLVAAGAFEAIVTRWPTDMLSVKALEFHYYVLGQQHMGPRFLAQMDRIADPNRGDADFLAAWAFAAELSGQLERAADLAEEAISIKPHTAWAHHALAHVFITRGDPPEALARLRSFLPAWETSGRVVHCHNAWHLAVAHLDKLDRDGADGVWADVADHVETRVHECVFPFLSAHHGYALARAGRTDALEALRASVQRRVDADDGESARVWQPVGVAVVEASIAHGSGALAAAATLLDSVQGQMTAIGGSDAQDDLFRLALLTALAGSGRPADARSYWSAITAFKTPSPLDEHLLAAI